MAEFVPSILVSFSRFPAFFPLAGALSPTLAAAACRRSLATTLVGYHWWAGVSREKVQQTKRRVASVRGRVTGACESKGIYDALHWLPCNEWEHALPTEGTCRLDGWRASSPRIVLVDLALLPPERWCERGDSNPHPVRDQILSLARLPIPPLSRASIIRQVSMRALPPERSQPPHTSEVSAERR